MTQRRSNIGDLWLQQANGDLMCDWFHLEALWFRRDSVPFIRQFTTECTSLSSPLLDHLTYCDCALQQILINVHSIIHIMHFTQTVTCILKVLTKQKTMGKGFISTVNCHLISEFFKFNAICFEIKFLKWSADTHCCLPHLNSTRQCLHKSVNGADL